MYCSAYLVVGIVLQKEHIDNGELVDESVTLELLSDAGADGGDGLGDRVHGLDLRRLGKSTTVSNCPLLYNNIPLPWTYRTNPCPIGCKHSASRVGPIGRCSVCQSAVFSRTILKVEDLH